MADIDKMDFLIDVVVEIPKGSRNKYEYDYEKKMIRYDRMLFSSVHYPSDYGFFPETLAEDGDALDTYSEKCLKCFRINKI